MKESDRISALEAQVLELKIMVEKLIKSKSKKIDIDCNDVEKYLETLDKNSNYFVKAFGKFSQKKYDEAFILFKKCLEREPNNDKAYFYIGCIWEIKENYESAIANYIEASNFAPKNPAYLNKLADLYYKNDENEKAIEKWEQVLELDSEYEINYLSKAIAEWAQDVPDYEQAIIDCNIFINRNREDDIGSVVYSLKGDSEYCLERYEDAIKDLSKVLELDPDSAMDLHCRAKAYYQIDEYEKAIADWNKVLEIDSEYNIYYFEKAYAEYKIGEYLESIDDYTKYLLSNPDDAGAFNNRGLSKYKLENYVDSIEDYSRAIELKPERAKFIDNRAEAYYWNDEYNKALEDWNRVLKIEPDYDVNYYYKAYSEKELKLYEDAIISIDKYLSTSPDDEEALILKDIINSNLS